LAAKKSTYGVSINSICIGMVHRNEKGWGTGREQKGDKRIRKREREGRERGGEREREGVFTTVIGENTIDGG
jgi:hypothetical protein